jgi:hypothetical protein
MTRAADSAGSRRSVVARKIREIFETSQKRVAS